MVGPNYKRPAIALPASFRAPEPLPPAQAESIADLKWFEVFSDEKLRDLIRMALERNYDLRDAVARVEGARAVLGVQRSFQYPTFDAGAALDINRVSRDGVTPISRQILPSQNRNFGTAALQLLSFEIDIWGRLRRATEAARANLLDAEENRKAVVTTLVGDVATSYFALRELDYELEISRRTLQTREQSLDLTKSRLSGGVSTLLDLRQSEQLVYTAAESIPQIQKQIEETENQINRLLGHNPGGILRGRTLTEEILPPEVPVGLPSALLERRPDIRAAEQGLIAANAEIGVARAAYFPTVSLSGALGGSSTQLTSLFSGPNSTWSVVPQVTQPIFTAGRIKSNVRLVHAEHDRALIQYERTAATYGNSNYRSLSSFYRAHPGGIRCDHRGTDALRYSFVSVIVSVLIVTIIAFSSALSTWWPTRARGTGQFLLWNQNRFAEPDDTKVSAIPSSNCCFAEDLV
jgi:outer membrane protein, multidrug efflux system